VINKIRALCSWYSKGLEGGSHLRVRVNAAESLSQLREMIGEFFEVFVASPGGQVRLKPDATILV
jgi:tRNA-dihydrouridine synthase